MLKRNETPKHSSGGFSHSDIAFIKSYSKPKKSYEDVSIASSNNFDCEARQVPFKRFLEAKRKDYSRCKHFSKIRRTLPREKANELILKVDEINDYTRAMEGV